MRGLYHGDIAGVPQGGTGHINVWARLELVLSGNACGEEEFRSDCSKWDV